MKNKLFWIALILLLITTSSGFARQTKAGQHPPLDPYTEIQLPLEDLPALNKDLVYHPVLDPRSRSFLC